MFGFSRVHLLSEHYCVPSHCQRHNSVRPFSVVRPKIATGCYTWLLLFLLRHAINIGCMALAVQQAWQCHR